MFATLTGLGRKVKYNILGYICRREMKRKNDSVDEYPVSNAKIKQYQFNNKIKEINLDF